MRGAPDDFQCPACPLPLKHAQEGAAAMRLVAMERFFDDENADGRESGEAQTPLFDN